MVADGHGGVWAVGVRDCSLQRRNQKVIEESAAPGADRRAGDAAIADAAPPAWRWRPATGTRDGGVPLRARRPALLVHGGQHPAPGRAPGHRGITGLDLVKLQLHVAAGGRLRGEPPAPSGHAIEARLNAEDPDARLRARARPDRAAAPAHRPRRPRRHRRGEGDVIPPEFDSMIAKVIAWGHDRDEALARLRRALAETHGRRRGRHDATRRSCWSCSVAPRCVPARSTPPGSTRWHARGEHVPREHGDAWPAAWPPPIDAYDARRRPRTRTGSSPPPRAAAPKPRRGGHARRTAPPRAPAIGFAVVPGGAPGGYRVTVDGGDDRGERRAARALRARARTAGRALPT